MGELAWRIRAAEEALEDHGNCVCLCLGYKGAEMCRECYNLLTRTLRSIAEEHSDNKRQDNSV